MTPFVPAPYHDRDFKVRAVQLPPGRYWACTGEVGIVTVLGSCVAACLWDPVEGIAGMNHFMLPEDVAAATSMRSARFGVHAMELLINEMLKLGAERGRLVAKVFGGGRMLQGPNPLEIGTRNADFVREFLQVEGIPLLAQDLGGRYARKLHFSPATGKVWMIRLDESTPQVWALQESRYREQLRREVPGGEVELFDPITARTRGLTLTGRPPRRSS